MSWFKSKKPMTEEELSRINWHPTSPRDEFLWRDLAIEENFNVASKAAYLADTKLRLVLDVISSLTGKAISSEDFATYVAPDLFQVINLGGIHNMGPREREYFAVAGWNTLGTIFPGRIKIATAFMSKLNENKLFHLVEAIAIGSVEVGRGMATVADFDDQLRRMVQFASKAFTFEYPEQVQNEAAGSITGKLYFDTHLSASEAMRLTGEPELKQAIEGLEKLSKRAGCSHYQDA